MKRKPARRESILHELPPDVAPGEAEFIEGFYRWLKATNPNPRRIGCPGKLALAELVVAESKFEDAYTLKHIGECAACVDDLTELRLEYERMNKVSK